MCESDEFVTVNDTHIAIGESIGHHLSRYAPWHRDTASSEEQLYLKYAAAHIYNSL